MARVFTKKKLEFKNRETGQTVKTSVLDFYDLPEWATKDPLYNWAKSDGDLEEIGTESSVKKSRQSRELGED